MRRREPGVPSQGSVLAEGDPGFRHGPAGNVPAGEHERAVLVAHLGANETTHGKAKRGSHAVPDDGKADRRAVGHPNFLHVHQSSSGGAHYRLEMYGKRKMFGLRRFKDVPARQTTFRRRILFLIKTALFFTASVQGSHSYAFILV